jgi:glycosyltransferase involved in cell wall biosynthesis
VAAAPEISIVLPCYNEEGNLRKIIAAIRAADKACYAITKFYGTKQRKRSL